MYYCGRCEKTFENKEMLQKHLKHKIPCDFFCEKCGFRFTCAAGYSRHQNNSKCDPKEYSEKEYQRQLTKIRVNNDNIANDNSTNTTNNDNSTNTNTHSNNNIKANTVDMSTNITQNTTQNFYINITKEEPPKLKMYGLSRLGFYPHEDESFEHIYEFASLMGMLFKQVMEKGVYDHDTLDNLLTDLAKLFHSNAYAPEYMNIMDDNAQSEHNKIYSGAQFIDDVMPKTIRNKRVVQRIINKVRRYCILPGISDDILEFCNKVFEPFLVDIYVTSPTHDNLQKTWQFNKQVLDHMDLQRIPKSAGRHLGFEDMKKQCDSMLEQDATIHNEYAKRNMEKRKEMLSSSMNSLFETQQG